MKKIIAGIFIILLLLIIAAALAPFIVDLDKYKGTILSRIKPYIAREIDFEHIELTIFTGLGAELQGLRISGNPAFSQEDFIQLDSLQIKVQLLPLLKLKVKVKKFILKHPVVRLARNAEGVFCFSDLVSAEKTSPSEENNEPEEASPGMEILAGLLVNELEIQEGKIIYQDDTLFSGAGPVVIDSLDLMVKDLSLLQPLSIELAAKLLEEATEQNFKLTGQIGPVGEDLQIDNIPFDIQVLLHALPIEALGAGLPEDLTVQPFSGKLDVKLTARGSLNDQISSEGEIALQDLVMQMAREEGVVEKSQALHCTLSHNLVMEYPKEKLSLESVTASVNGNKLFLQGKVENFLTGLRWDAKVRTEDLQPDSLVAIFPLFAEKVPPELHLAGPVVINLQSSGTEEEFLFTTKVDMNKLQVKYEDMFNKSADIPFSFVCKGNKEGERLVLKEIKLVLHHLIMTVAGEVINKGVPRFALRVQTNPIGLEGWDKLVPLLAPYHPEGSFFLRSSLRGVPEDVAVNLQVSSDKIQFVLPPAEDQKQASPKGDPGRLEGLNVQLQAKQRDAQLRGTGKVEIKKGEISSVLFEKMASRFRYDPEQLHITGLTVNAFQGAVRGEGAYDLSKGTWRFQPNVRNVALGEVLDTLTEYRNVFSGKFNGQFMAESIAEKGDQGDIQSNGMFRISQGELKNFNLVGSVLDSLFKVKGVDQFLKGLGNDIQRQENSRFDWLDGKFSLAENILSFQNLQFHNLGTKKMTDSDAIISGKIFLDSNKLKLKGSVVLSKRHSLQLTQQAKALKALYNTDQRIVLPITVKGTIEKPKPFLNVEYVQKAMAKYYGRQGVEKGVKELQKKLGIPVDKGAAEKLLKDLFR